MNPSQTFAGQSLVFNILFVLLNLAGLTLLTMGYHDAFEESKWLYAGIGYGLMALTTLALIIFKGRIMMATFSRVLVGSLFIVSGLIKANDPIGFSYKLEEYFEDGALAFRIKEWFSAPGFTLEFLIDWALFLSVIICVVEIVLGVLVLLGGKIKLVSWLLVLMMLFFTFLTWHTANCDPDKKFVDRDTYEMSNPLAQIKIDEAKTNKEIKIISKTSTELVVEEKKGTQCVSDCGCFGDAMKGSIGRSLTPKESLWKDIVLLYLVVWIFVAQRKVEPNSRTYNFRIVPISLILITFFCYIFGWYFPLIFGLIAIMGALWVLKTGGVVFGNYWGSTLLVSALSFMLTSYVLMFEPVKDYRPYAVGSNLIEKMSDGKEGVYESGFLLKNLKTGKNEYFSQAEYMDTVRKIWEDKNYQYVSTETKEIVPTVLPSITGQFNPVVQVTEVSEDEKALPFIKELLAESRVQGVVLYDQSTETEISIPLSEYNFDDYDSAFYKKIKEVEIVNPEINEISIREYLTKEKQVLVLFSKKLNEVSDKELINQIKDLIQQAKKNNIPMVLVCSSGRNDINSWKKKYGVSIPAFTNDETELKAIARSNPSLMLIQNGVVKGKYPYRSMPTYSWLKKHVLK